MIGLARSWHRLRRNPVGLAGTLLFLLFLLMAVFGSLVAPYDFQAQDISGRLQPPGPQHFCGTDQYGRDIFSRILAGSRSIFLLSGTGTILAALIGVSIGLLSGYYGRLWDEALMRILDVLLSFPPLLFALLLLATVGPSQLNLLLVVSVLYVPMLARLARGMVLDLKTREFIEAARIRGERGAVILFREILPNALAPLLVEMSVRFSYAIFLVASLGFLGLGVQPPSPDWGLQINEARSYFSTAPWILILPAAAISLLVVATNLMTDGLRQALRQGTGKTSPWTRGRPVFRTEGLSIGYETDTGLLPAVRDATMEIAPRECFGLVGESGSGKTTLAMGAIGYLGANGRVISGSARLGDIELTGLSRARMRSIWGRRIGMVYQNPSTALNPSLRVGRQLCEIVQAHLGLSRREARQAALEMLDRVAIPDPEAVLGRYPHQLSGGMLQRCVIAMALSTRPEMLILDEPTTALDVTTQAVVLDLVKRLKSRLDSSILYITHDLAVVSRLCDRVGVMYAGQFCEQAGMRELYKRPLHPYTLGLLGCVPRFDPSASDGRASGARRLLASIPGLIPRLDELPKGCIFAPRCVFARAECTRSRPPMVEALPGHFTSCLRWKALPSAAEYVKAAPEISLHVAQRPEVLRVQDLRKTYAAVERLFAAGAARGTVRAQTAPPSGGTRTHVRNTVRAVDGVTLWVRQGNTLGVVGESGCGKTTMLRAIAGLAPRTSGDVFLNGRSVEAAVARRARSTLKALQMVFQNPEASLNPRHTVGKAIERPLLLLARVPRRDIPSRVRALLDAVNLPESYARRLPEELSGGEKQRAAIARAFAAEPEVILLDEPLSSLDVSVQASLVNLLTRLQESNGVSYLFISHDLAAVQHLSHWIAVMYLGSLMEWGDAADVFAPPFHPYTEALLSAIPVADPDVMQKPIRLEGSVPSALNVPAGCRFHTRCPRKLGVICETATPPWREGKKDHRISCHIPLEELAKLQADTIVRAGTRETPE